MTERLDARTEELAALVTEHHLTVAVAESLTAGKLATALGAATDAAEWFRGGVVAYSTEVKRDVLGVPDVPAVSATAAAAMAEGARTLMSADIAVATTGVGGPAPDGDEPAGSVWFAVACGDEALATHRQFAGEPVEVLDHSVTHAVELLLEAAASVVAGRRPITCGLTT